MAIEVRNYKNTGLQYIMGKDRVLFKHGGVVALVTDFREWDSRNIVLSQVLGLAGRPECSGYDFDHAAKTGQLRRRQRTDAPVTETTPEVAHAPIPAAAPPLTKQVDEEPPTVQEPVPEPVPEPQPVPEEPVQEPQVPFYHMIVVDQPEEAEEAPDEPAMDRLFARLRSSAHEKWLYYRQIREARREHREYQQQYDEPKQPKPVKQKKKRGLHHIHSSTTMMLGVIVIVGLGSLLMSAYHIITYMYAGGRPQEIAIVTGVIMTLFSAIAFTAARYFFSSKKFSGALIGAAFIAFGVIVIAFAMFSTIKVNYDQFKAGDEQKVTAAVTTSTKVSDAVVRAAFVDGELKRIDAEIKKAQAEYDKWSRLWNNESLKGEEANADLKWQYWGKQSTANKKLTALGEERKPFAAEKMNPSNAISAVEDAVKQETKDATIFGMFAKLFGIDEDTLKFIVYIIPAVFYDLMCPFALTVSFMLIDKREEELELNAKGERDA